jgi:Rrf2 family transcriptional regulator, iron-sulfur cluster assembly transcription factor
MLKINRQTDYAVRILLALAKQGEGTRRSSSEIQQEMLIPAALMPRIVAQLAHAGLLNTFPGREGGLMLPRPAAQITLRDVVEAFEGPILLSECLQAKSEDDCPFRTDCPVSPKWGQVQVAMLREMAAITFESLAQEALGMALKTPTASLVC